jgi:hypothetical protein
MRRGALPLPVAQALEQRGREPRHHHLAVEPSLDQQVRLDHLSVGRFVSGTGPVEKGPADSTNRHLPAERAQPVLELGWIPIHLHDVELSPIAEGSWRDGHVLDEVDVVVGRAPIVFVNERDAAASPKG